MVRISLRIGYIRYPILIIILGRLNNKYTGISFKYYINTNTVNIKITVKLTYIKAANYNSTANKKRLF